MAPLASLPRLRLLHLDGCYRLRDLSPLTTCTALQGLTLLFCDSAPLATLASMPQLRSLKCVGCFHLSSAGELDPLRTYTALTALTISTCGITSVEPLRDLVGLSVLNLGQCVCLQALDPLSGLTRLTSMDVSNCPITDLGPIAQPLLSDLKAVSCPLPFSLEPLRRCPALQLLNLSHAKGATGWQHLSQLTGLRVVMALRCEQLHCLSCFAGSVTGLRALQVAYTRVSDCRALAPAAHLVMLDLSHCPALRCVAPLASCNALVSLNLACVAHGSVLDLSPLVGLRDLRRLDVRRCQLVSESAARDWTPSEEGEEVDSLREGYPPHPLLTMAGRMQSLRVSYEELPLRLRSLLRDA